jgi:hypothetical protein
VRRAFALGIAALALVGAAPERGDPTARLSGADGALEYWDFVASFEQGWRLVERVLITNEGPGERTAVAVGHLVKPDGSVVAFRNGRLVGRWSIEPDGRKLKIGSSSLDLRGSVRTLAYDNAKRGIQLSLRFLSAGPARFPSTGERPAYRSDLLDLATPVEGSVRLEGMAAPLALRGRGTLTHTWMDESEPTLARRRLEFTSLDGDDGFFLQDLLSPDGVRRSWLVIERGGALVAERSDLEVEILDEEPPRGLPGYPVPARLRLRGDGISGEVKLRRILVEHEPLGDLPQPFRFLLSFVMRPRRAWTDASFSVSVVTAADQPAVAFSGNGIASVTYLTPLESPAP